MIHRHTMRTLLAIACLCGMNTNDVLPKKIMSGQSYVQLNASKVTPVSSRPPLHHGPPRNGHDQNGDSDTKKEDSEVKRPSMMNMNDLQRKSEKNLLKQRPSPTSMENEFRKSDSHIRGPALTTNGPHIKQKQGNSFTNQNGHAPLAKIMSGKVAPAVKLEIRPLENIDAEFKNPVLAEHQESTSPPAEPIHMNIADEQLSRKKSGVKRSFSLFGNSKSMFIDAHLDDDDVDLTDNSKRIKSLDGNRGKAIERKNSQARGSMGNKVSSFVLPRTPSTFGMGAKVGSFVLPKPESVVIGVRKSFAKITNRASLTRQSMIDREEIEQEVSTELQKKLADAADVSHNLRVRLLMSTTLVGFIFFVATWAISDLLDAGVLSENTFGNALYYHALRMPFAVLMCLGLMPNDGFSIRVLSCVFTLTGLMIGVTVMIATFNQLFHFHQDAFKMQDEDGGFKQTAGGFHVPVCDELPNISCGIVVSEGLIFSVSTTAVALVIAQNLVKMSGSTIWNWRKKRGTRFNDDAFKVPSRKALNRIWQVGRAYALSIAVLIFAGEIIYSQLPTRLAPWYTMDEIASRMFTGAVHAFVAGFFTTDRRHNMHAYLNSLSAHGEALSAASVAALLGNVKAKDGLALAKSKFRSIDFSELTPQDFKSSKEKGEHKNRLFDKTKEEMLGCCDAFISHSWSDDGPHKFEALKEWAKEFRETEGIMEVFTFLKMGGSIKRIEVIPINMKDANDAKKKFDDVDVSKCACHLDKDKQKLLGIVEQGFGNFEEFNEIVRHVFKERVSVVHANKHFNFLPPVMSLIRSSRKSSTRTSSSERKKSLNPFNARQSFAAFEKRKRRSFLRNQRKKQPRTDSEKRVARTGTF